MLIGQVNKVTNCARSYYYFLVGQGPAGLLSFAPKKFFRILDLVKLGASNWPNRLSVIISAWLLGTINSSGQLVAD